VTLNGRPARLSDLRPGDQITVTSPKTELGTALTVRATRGEDTAARNARNRSNQPPENPQAALGVFLDDAPVQGGEGILIRDVAPGSAAAQAGIRPGDRIVAIEDQEVSSARNINQAMSEKNPGDELSLQVRRGDRTMSVNATLGAQRDLAFRPNEQERQRRSEDGQSSQAWLGIMLRDERQPGQPGEEEAQQHGAVVDQVYPSGPAARAGLRSGDVIVRLGEHDVKQLDDLYQAMDRLEPNEQVEITVRRNGEEEKLTATLASREDFFGEQPFRGFRGDEFFGGEFPRPRDMFGGAPEHSMMLEQQRHLAMQHQRLEDLLNDVLEELKQLRQEVQQMKGREPVPPANP
jgi:type II secretory pathway component PulC